MLVAVAEDQLHAITLRVEFDHADTIVDQWGRAAQAKRAALRARALAAQFGVVELLLAPIRSGTASECSANYPLTADSLQLTQGNPHGFAHFRVAVILHCLQRCYCAAIIQFTEGQRGFLAQVADAMAEGLDQGVQGRRKT